VDSLPPKPDLLDLWRETRDGWSPLMSEPVLRVALAHVQEGLSPGAVVLDVGSEKGHLSAAAARYGARAVGVDARVDALASSRARYPEARWLAARAETLPLADGSVDALLALSVLQYTDRAAALAEFRRVLRPGGRFVAVENLRGNPIARAFRWRMHLSRRGYGAYYAPIEHLSWGERRVFEAHFGRVRFHVLHLLSPGLAALPGAGAAPEGGLGGRVLRALFGGVRRLDGALLALPPLRALGWQMVVCGIREQPDTHTPGAR
jgi:SAM-dependent methyltransferase